MRLPSDQDASGRTLGDEEIDALREVIESGTLTSTKGSAVRDFELAAAELLGVGHAVACASGSFAVHAAIAALDPEPGDEVVTTPVTDMGALAPILYQGAIPVFADVDPLTGNITADTVASVMSERTRAVVVTHLFGRPADTSGIATVAAGVPVIEDCAQAWLARHGGRPVGGAGALGSFSLQQGKHLTCGEGGLVTTDDPDTARYVRLWVNKGWAYGEPDPDHRWLAPNARITELQGAVALAQLAKLRANVDHRIAMAGRLSARLAGVPGLTPPGAADGDVNSYWRYPLLVDETVIPRGPATVAVGLKAWTVPSAPRYIQKPAFRCGLFVDQKTFGTSRWPFSLARPEATDYDPTRFPGTFSYLDHVLVLPWSERLTEEHVDHIADALTDAVAGARSSGSARDSGRPSDRADAQNEGSGAGV